MVKESLPTFVLVWRIYTKRHNSYGHFKYIKKHKIIPKNCCFGVITLCSPKKSLFLLNSNKSSSVLSLSNYLCLKLWQNMRDQLISWDTPKCMSFSQNCLLYCLFISHFVFMQLAEFFFSTKAKNNLKQKHAFWGHSNNCHGPSCFVKDLLLLKAFFYISAAICIFSIDQPTSMQNKIKQSEHW